MAATHIVSHENFVRLIAFAVILALLILWERTAAVRTTRVHSLRRWSTNGGFAIIDTLILRLILPAGALGAAALAAKLHLGLFNQLPVTGFVALAASLLLLDLTIYLQHRLFHALPWLWRIHRVHHADPQIDVSTALRFHPAESVLSMLLKMGVVITFGMPMLGVLLFEIILNAAAMFNHASASLPPRLERLIGLAIVTPDMHRIHHSTRIAQANRNFGFCASGWDRLFGSYCAPDKAPAPDSIGLPDAPAAPEHLRLTWLLLMPFRK
jgi:sterol desaturase/sphingolipid hydroxylase (fatty acid hydroxylase superfamily)